jgi:serralysin
LLIDGDSIAQVPRDRVRYFHVELTRHAVILAEGLTVESYLDSGDRANFSGCETIRLFPDFVARLWESHGAAPLVMTGAGLEAARRMVVGSRQVAGLAIGG